MQLHAVKKELLARAIPNISRRARNFRAVGMTASCQRNRHGINHVIQVRRLPFTQARLKLRPDGLKRRFQLIKPGDKGLVRGQFGEKFAPVVADKFVHRLFFIPSVEMGEPIDRNQFLIRDATWFGIIAQALKTSAAPVIVHLTGKRIQLNELEGVFHRTILLARHACLSIQPLIHIKLHRLPAQQFLQLVESKVGFAPYLLQEISQQRNEYAIRQAQLATISARARLAQVMLEFMCDQVEASATRIRVPFPFPDKDLASYLMVTPAYLSRMYRSLMNDGIIHRHGGASFVLDLNCLRQEAKGSYRKEGTENLNEAAG